MQHDSLARGLIAFLLLYTRIKIYEKSDQQGFHNVVIIQFVLKELLILKHTLRETEAIN